MSIELAIAGASIGVASIVAIAALGNEHLSNPLRTVHQQNTPHPMATNIIAGAAAGVSTLAVALALSIPIVAVTWSLGALTVWAVAAWQAGTCTSVFAQRSSFYPSPDSTSGA